MSLELAKAVALVAHHGQMSRYEEVTEPYLHHVERVSAGAQAEWANRWKGFRVELWAPICAVAYLHDVLEDSSQFTVADISRLFADCPQVVEAVLLLTRHDPYEPYADYIQRIVRSGNELAVVVKIADIRDHLRPSCPEHLRGRYEAALTVLTGE